MISGEIPELDLYSLPCPESYPYYNGSHCIACIDETPIFDMGNR